MKKKIVLVLAFVATILTVGLFTQPAKAQTTVKIASDIAYAPFEFQDSNKNWTGIDVDLIKRVAEINDWNLEMSFPGFDAAVSSLQSGQVDGVIAGMSITDARKQTFDFSDPYFPSSIVVATTKEHQISSYDNLKGKTVGVKNGTAAQTWLQENQKKYGYTVKTYKDGVAMLAALKSGAVSAVMDENPVLSYAAKQGEDLSINVNPVTLGSYGFAVMKDKHPELISAFNSALAQLKADGEYDQILAKYGVSVGNTSTSSSNQKITPKKSVYTITSDNSFAPFEFQGSDKKYTGIDVDLLNAIAKEQGFTLNWQFNGFQASVDAVQSGQADAMIAGMSITDARKAVFDFSDPYYSSNLTLAVAKEKASSYTSWTSFKGKTIAAKNGTASLDYLNAHASENGYTVKVYADATSMYASLKNGSIAAFMDDEPVVQYAIKQGQDFATPLKAIPSGQYGFAVKSGQNPELIQMFNQGLADLKANGQYDKILNNYLATSSSSNSGNEKTFWGIIQNNWKQLGQGLLVTLELALLSFVLAMIVGTIFGLFTVSPNTILRGIARVYIDIIRGIPLLVFTFFLFFGIPNILQAITGHQSPLNEFVAGTIALTLNASAYIAEIIRGGVNAVPVGQMEASRSLGVPYVRTMRKVILPQAFKITTPSLINQFIISLKDTTLVSVIGLVELLQTGQIIVARNFQSFLVYGIIGLIYLIVIELLTLIARRIERSIQ